MANRIQFRKSFPTTISCRVLSILHLFFFPFLAISAFWVLYWGLQSFEKGMGFLKSLHLGISSSPNTNCWTCYVFIQCMIVISLTNLINVISMWYLWRITTTCGDVYKCFGLLFCSNDLQICFCASTMLFQLQHL